MSSHNLQSACTYVNNLLLARGLLPDGKTIDFASLSNGTDDHDTTISRIINLVHDLVLRRDRDGDQREALATTVRSMRSEESQRILDLQRLQDKNIDLTRELTHMEAQSRASQASVRRLESHARDLKEQMLKMKSTLDQVRAKCVGDIRKRDAEIEKLKGHISGLQRGKKDTSGMKINTINPQPSTVGGRGRGTGQDLHASQWNLEQESNDFLAALVNETSTENVALRDIVNESIEILKDLTGIEAESTHESEEDGIGIPGQYRKSRQKRKEEAQEASLVACDTLAANMKAVLEHCRSILKDPSFVPIEEVEIRDEEIIKLREGWEKMAGRWKEAVVMMDTWRRRMLENGESVQIDELSQLEFGRSVATLPNGQPVLGQAGKLPSALDETSEAEEDQVCEMEINSEDDLIIPPADSAEESELELPMEPSPKRLAASPARRGLKLPRPAEALGEINGNLRALAPLSTRLSSLAHSGESEVARLDGSADQDDENASAPNHPRSKIPRQVSCTIAAEGSFVHLTQTKKENIPPVSIQEKLAAVEAEAQEAEAKRKEGKPQKRKQTNPGHRKASRRRSTLSPEELAALMGVR